MSGGADIAKAVLLTALAALPAAAADDLGRLFTTPSERAQLDESRRGAPAFVAPVIELRNPDTGERTVEDASTLTLRGVVERSAGRSTAWVNDTNTYQGDVGAAHRQVQRSAIGGDTVTVALPDGQSSVQMKVGQTLDTTRGQIRDLGTEPEPEPDAGVGPPADAEEDDEE